MMKYSFIIPVYNCELYLNYCVNNIIQINRNDYEIILIDDGSIDGSGQICDNLALKYDNIRCIHQKNQGVSAARNRGLELSSGEYVVFLDADDDIEPKKFLKLLQVLEQDDTIDMVVYGLAFDYYHEGQRYRRDELEPGVNGKVISVDWVSKIPLLYQTNALSPIWNKILKRSILADNQLKLRRNMFLYEDFEFSLRCMACCETIYFCSDIIYYYRQSEDEGNAGRRLKRVEHLPELIDKIESALDELIEKKGIKSQQNQIKKILLSLYLVLAREKISVSNAIEIRQICDDFTTWLEGREFQIFDEQQKFVKQLMNRQVRRLVAARTYTAVRHKIAVIVKNTEIYQKLRG